MQIQKQNRLNFAELPYLKFNVIYTMAECSHDTDMDQR